MNFMAATGFLNTVFSVYMWFKWLGNSLDDSTSFWFSWFFAVLTNGLLWIPLFVTWPAVFTAGSTTVNLMAFLSRLTLLGSYFFYWANLGFMYYTFYSDPAGSGSKFVTTSDATPYFAGYAGLSLFDSMMSFLFVGSIQEYADRRNKADALEEARQEAIKNAESGRGSGGSSPSGDNSSDEPVDNDDNIVVFKDEDDLYGFFAL
uniref:Uncharacterized protein n=1 Tax=Favella ehrenbergii TaxID=182087 RepID=A0A7S3HXE7_9SPIT|mmetsp:Transcript_18538/g.23078  ORF Transcript_18538/g.23078 Transcript_18538/m.23078 type:complete len:204 (+) Transcript_18538:884-1495(+)